MSLIEKLKRKLLGRKYRCNSCGEEFRGNRTSCPDCGETVFSPVD